MNKTLGLFLMVMSATASGAVPIDHRAQNFYEAMSMFYEQKFRAGAKLKTWKERYLDYQNEAKLDERGDCYGKSEGDVILVLQVEKDGIVSKVYVSKENEKAECFIKVYKGEKLPPPPIAPTYELMRML